MKRTIRISGLRLYARHGVMEQERQVGNMFEVSLSILYPFDSSDRLGSTLNYAEAVEVIKEVMKRPHALLETVAFAIKDTLIARYPAIEGGSVTVAKPAPPIPGVELDAVSVTIEWP